MILKEFDLDLPYVGSSKEDYELNWKSRRMQFRDEARCVASMFERLFKPYKFKTLYTWKILIECYNDISLIRNLNISSDIYTIAIKFDVIGYFGSDNNRKKQIIFDSLKEGLETLLKIELDWDRMPFEEVLKTMQEKELLNTYLWGKTTNSSRTYSAALSCEHEIDGLTINLIVYNKKQGIIYHKHILTEKPNEWDYTQHFGTLYWESKNEIVLKNKQGIELIRKAIE